GRFVNDEWKPGLIEQLAQTDYVGISSARVYGAVQRLPHRYPATLRYYQALFDGSLGFDLVGDFVSLPTILGVPIDDTGAEESFTVYDHPRVFIFKRTERFTPENAKRIIVGDQVWDEVYRTSARLTNEASTMLRLTDRVWKSLSASDTAYLLRGPTGLPALLLWLGAVELLGLAAFGIAWHWRLFPPQRALGLARFLGLVLFAVPPALLATRWSVGRAPLAAWYGLVVAFGLRLAWFRRRGIRAAWREARGMILQQEAVYAAFLLLALAIRLLAASSSGAGDELHLAQWLAVLRSPAFPPYDPLFAGGHLTVPYAALLPVAAVAKLVGIGAPLGFDLAHATLFALLALLVWVTLAPARGRRSAPQSAAAPPILAEQSLEQREVEESGASIPGPEPASAASSPMARRPRLWATLVPLLGVGLALMPGLPAGPWREPGAVGSLLSGALAPVGALMLVAGAITLALEAMRRTERHGLRSSAGVLLLWLLTLALLAGQSIALLGIVTGLVAGLGLLERGREAARWVVIAAVAALIAAVLGRGWNWSVVQPVLQDSPAPAVWMFLAAICVALLPALLMLARDVRSVLGVGRGSAAVAIVVVVATAGAWVSARVPQAAAGILGRFALAVPMAVAAL
ncbi:MAG TPA: DUF2298 domain-containing protein, partial [Herpetosiphonaceae bacterium]|nr:DUF2298 domain-containing protein [Herpetosiphonaceae bacterium]